MVGLCFHVFVGLFIFFGGGGTWIFEATVNGVVFLTCSSIQSLLVDRKAIHFYTFILSRATWIQIVIRCRHFLMKPLG